MAVPKRFKFKTKKKKFSQINNNSKFVLPCNNKYFLSVMKLQLWR